MTDDAQRRKVNAPSSRSAPFSRFVGDWGVGAIIVGVVVVGLGIYRTATNVDVSTFEAVLVGGVGLVASIVGSARLSRAATVSPVLAKSLTRNVIMTGNIVRNARAALKDTPLDSEVPPEVHGLLARVETALELATGQLSNVVDDLIELQPDAEDLRGRDD